MESSKLFWESSIEELEAGYKLLEGAYICLLCGKSFEEGLIYRISGNKLMDAERAVKEHIAIDHRSSFDSFLQLDRKYTGLSEQQQTMMQYFYEGVGDKEISKRLGLAQSTVRNYRFRIKEKARQAKIFLILHHMMEKSFNEEDRIVDIHRSATMIDERYSVTESERLERLSRFFNENGEFTRFPKKEKDKVIFLREIVRVFKPGLNYSEEQANEMLKAFYDDYVLLRRYLIEYGLIERKPDGSAFRLVF